MTGDDVSLCMIIAAELSRNYVCGSYWKHECEPGDDRRQHSRLRLCPSSRSV